MLRLPSPAYFTRLWERLRFQKHTNTREFEVTALGKKKKPEKKKHFGTKRSLMFQ